MFSVSNDILWPILFFVFVQWGLNTMHKGESLKCKRGINENHALVVVSFSSSSLHLHCSSLFARKHSFDQIEPQNERTSCFLFVSNNFEKQ